MNKFKVGDKVKIVRFRDSGALYSAGGYPMGYEFIVDYIAGEGGIYYPKDKSGAFEDELDFARVTNWKSRLVGE